VPLRLVKLYDSLIGQELPWDLYNASGVLVAGAGMVVSDDTQLSRLSMRHLYREIGVDLDDTNLLSRLRYAMHVYPAALEAIGTPQLEGKIREIAGILISLAKLDFDASLGLSRLLPLTDPVLRHCLLTAQFTICLGMEKELPEAELESLTAAALTMNIGALHMHGKLATEKAAIPPHVRAELQRHPDRSAGLLEVSRIEDPDWLEAVRQHHENLDGSGYPDGLNNNDIFMGARMIRVADYYTAKIDGCRSRPNKSARFAFKQLLGGERGKIDSHIAVLLLRRLGLYPAGTLIRLASRETAVVLRKGSDSNSAGLVSVFIGPNGRVLHEPITRDSAHHVYAAVDIVKSSDDWPQIAWERFWGY
jgi:hypothetical protein